MAAEKKGEAEAPQILDETTDDIFTEGPARYLGLAGRVGRCV